MKNELKKYIEDNLNYKESEERGLFKRIKKILFSDEEEMFYDEDIDFYEEKNEKQVFGRASSSPSSGRFEKRANLFLDEDYEEEIEDEKSISNVEEDLQIPSFLRSEDIKIDDYINKHSKYNDFQTTLFRMIDERNLIDSDVYNKVHIDRRLFSKIRNDKTYHPSKETILLLGLSLELNEDEIVELLDSASYSLPKNNHYDLIIRFCFLKGIYKINDVNELLDQYHCKLFNY